MRDHAKRIHEIEFQTKRLVSDFVSEKRNHADKHREMDAERKKQEERLRKLEVAFGGFVGGLVAINAVLAWLKYFGK